MKRQIFSLCALGYSLLMPWLALAYGEAVKPTIVVTIKPLHAMVQQIVEDDATILRLVEDGQSPHQVHLTPQQRRMIEQADAIIMMDPALESFMIPFASDYEIQHKMAAMSMIRTLKLLPARTPWLEINAPSYGFSRNDAVKFTHDPHLWMDVRNMHLMMGYTAEYLGSRFPQHRETFLKRAHHAQEQLEALDKNLETRLDPVKNRPFVMVHDALHYLEQRYGMKSTGSIDLASSTLTPMQMKRVYDLFAKHKVHCVVYEKGLPEATVQRMIGSQTQRALAAVDVFGYDVAIDAEFYDHMMHRVVDALIPCVQKHPQPQQRALGSLPNAS